jgi:uncharacterized protein YjbI with pentapeptide repeats
MPGKMTVQHDCVNDSEFEDLNMAGSTFNNINLSGARFHDINFSDVTFTAVNLGGTLFKHLGPMPDKDSKQERQRPITFEEAMLCDSTFHACDLSGVKISECDLTGMTIDGVLVIEMVEAWKKVKD